MTVGVYFFMCALWFCVMDFFSLDTRLHTSKRKLTPVTNISFNLNEIWKLHSLELKWPLISNRRYLKYYTPYLRFFFNFCLLYVWCWAYETLSPTHMSCLPKHSMINMVSIFKITRIKGNLGFMSTKQQPSDKIAISVTYSVQHKRMNVYIICESTCTETLIWLKQNFLRWLSYIFFTNTI